MSLDAGTVSVADDETPTGSGMALALYTSMVTFITLPTLPALGATAAPYSAARPATQTDINNAQAGRLTALRGVAAQANGIATGLVPYVTANAEVHVGSMAAHVTNESLGRTPNPNAADRAIEPPSYPVDIPLAGTGTVT